MSCYLRAKKAVVKGSKKACDKAAYHLRTVKSLPSRVKSNTHRLPLHLRALLQLSYEK